MDHKLRVTVRVDVGSSSVCLDVGGCLTADSCASHEAERRELKVLPFCPLIRHFFSTHSEFLPLVPVSQRRRFNLA
ncbi:hypothetical protein GCM10027562_22710 [Arthrobacter pigmenti]